MKQQLVEDSATDQLELEVWDHNVQVVPTAAQVSVLVFGATEVSLANATVTSTGTCTYVPGATVLAELAENCVAEWKLTIAGATVYYRRMFDIVRYPLQPVITDEHLIAECAQLQEARYIESGLADSGTSSTLISTLLYDYQDNHFEGGTLEITDGSASGNKRIILSSVKATGLINVTTSFPSAIDSSSRFIAKRTFQREIDRAWEDVLAMVQTRGYRPSLVMNSEDLVPIHVDWTLVKICRNLATSPDDIWWKRSETFMQDYQANLGLMKFVYDENRDDAPDATKSFQPRFRR